MEVAEVICSFGFSNDHRAEVAKLRAKKVDAVITAEWTDQVMRMMKEQRLNAKLLGTANMLEAVKIRGAGSLLEGAYYTAWQGSPEFVEHFKSKFKQDPILEAENSYEIMQSIAKALYNSDGDLLAALKKLRYEGSVGLVDWTGGMAVNYGVGHLYQVRNGNIVLLN